MNNFGVQFRLFMTEIYRFLQYPFHIGGYYFSFLSVTLLTWTFIGIMNFIARLFGKVEET